MVLACGKSAGVGVLVGLVAGVLMVADGESAWSLLLAPPMFAVIGAATLGVVVGLIWMMSVGRVTYVVTPTHLLGYRGRWKREEVELARVESIELDEDIEWTDLVFTGWLGYTSPIPALVVHLDGKRRPMGPEQQRGHLLPSHTPLRRTPASGTRRP